jgi:hypothetical protein
VGLMAIVTMPAKADRPVTDAERAKLMVARCCSRLHRRQDGMGRG